MGEAVPLHFFKTIQENLKLYLDEQCAIEEEIDTSNTIQKVYKLKIPNVLRDKEKTIVRYIKNVGYEQLIFAVFPIVQEGVEIKFKTNDGEFKPIGNGIALPADVYRLEISVKTPPVGDYPELYLGIISRAMEQKI